jgi:hypothetical protein
MSNLLSVAACNILLSKYLSAAGMTTQYGNLPYHFLKHLWQLVAIELAIIILASKWQPLSGIAHQLYSYSAPSES